MRRKGMALAIAVGMAVAACSSGSTDSPRTAPAPTISMSSVDGSVVVERGADQAATASPAPSSTPSRPVEHGIVFGGFADVLGGMTVDQIRSRGWVLERSSEGDGCVDYSFRRGVDAIQVGTKRGTDVVSTVTGPTENGRVSAETARIRTASATYAQIVAAYRDASVTYTPPINRGPSGSIAKLLVASNAEPDNAILFTALGTGTPTSAPPPAGTVFTGAQGGTLSALSGGTFGCA